MSENNDLLLRSVSSLLGESFYIPSYQRGYRWTKRQVTELLDDIKEFQQSAESELRDAFYCLQPIVVKQRDDIWELVDGQQRLTTIFIILTYLKDIAALLGKERYKLSYETRKNSAGFLQNIDTARRDENIDFFHICQAKETVEEWFQNQQDSAYRLKFLQTLLNDDDTGKNVKVIWYQINTDDVTTVFTRLNIGKIPLVNAELVKALFLKSSNFEESGRSLQQLSIAQEWDAIEKRLQDDEFWYFISNQDVRSNRIEFVLNLAVLPLSCEGILSDDPLKTFLQFSHILGNGGKEAVSQEWLKIKQCFMTLEEWFNDRVLFHLIGYLIADKRQGGKVEELFELYGDCKTKKDFRDSLLNQIYQKLFPRESFDGLEKQVIESGLDQLGYHDGNSKIASVLLLFNIASLLANPLSNSRFQFDRFKADNWDIEHIRSVASEMPGSKDQQRIWLENVVDYISDANWGETSEANQEATLPLDKIREKSQSVLAGKTFDSELFEELFTQIQDLFDPGREEGVDHSIGNLTLLDISTNRSYQNAVFPVKRSRIIALDKQATFVPLCTKNVFLKYYSKHVDKMFFWETTDCRDYQQAMVDSLYNFFCGTGVHS